MPSGGGFSGGGGIRRGGGAACPKLGPSTRMLLRFTGISCSWNADTSNSGPAWKLGSCNLGGDGSGSGSTAEIGDFVSLMKLSRRSRGLPVMVMRFNADLMASTTGVLEPSDTGVGASTGSSGIINDVGAIIWRGFGGSGGSSSISDITKGESEPKGSAGNKSNREPSEWSPSSSIRSGVSVLRLPFGVFGREKLPDLASDCSDERML